MNDSQRWSAEAYAQHAHFVPALGEPVVQPLAPQPGEHILDVGCGDGTLTSKLAEAGAIVVGIDSSPELLEAARARGLDVRLADARRLSFTSEFDAVFSNAALHWITGPDPVLAGVYRALRPGGRFVAECGGQGNVAAICTALLGARMARGYALLEQLPWYFPSVDAYTLKLRAHGFIVDSIELFARPTALPTGMRGWLDTFAGPFLGDVATGDRGPLLDDACALLAPSLRDESGAWTADYVRLRFRAFR